MPPNGSFLVGRDGALEVRQLGADGHFALVGKLDMAAVDDLLEGLRRAISRGGTVTLDLRERGSWTSPVAMRSEWAA